MVVANELKTRRSQVTVYSKDESAETLVCEDQTLIDEISKQIVGHIRSKLGYDTQMESEGASPVGNQKLELYVTNIDFSTKEEQLREHFGQIGKLTKVKIVYQNGRSKGKAFVEYADQESANQAVAELNGKEFEGRELTVEYQGQSLNTKSFGGYESNR